MSRLLKVVLVIVVAAIALGSHARDARACGAFAAPRPATEGELAAKLPFLTVEQVLLIWDKETGTEDFIRETRFDQANQTFGFVVPTPTKPTVAGVKKAPFDALRKAYAFEPPQPPPAPRDLGGGGLKGAGAGGGTPLPPPVVVLSEQRIGSFTAFTLSATDAGAFDKWLADNGFAMTNEAKPWIAHYVALEFFFVALRYEPKATTGIQSDAPLVAGMTSETVRIRFKTPHPYYPYMEPAHPKGSLGEDLSPHPGQRMLTGWLVTREPMKAVAFKEPTERTDRKKWQRPWVDGLRHKASTADLARVVGAELGALLPKANLLADSLVVQTFRDLKVSRARFGDVLMVPETRTPLTPEDEASRKFLLPVIDPTLLAGAENDSDAGALVDASASSPRTSAEDGSVVEAGSEKPTGASSAQTSKRSPGGCSSSPVVATSGWIGWGIVLGASFVLARRSRRSHNAVVVVGALFALVVLVVLALVGCSRPKHEGVVDGAVDTPSGSSKAPAWASSSSSSAETEKKPPLTHDEKVKTALAILSGDEPPEGIAADPDQARVLRIKGDAQIGASVADIPIADADRVIAGLRARFRACYQTGLNSDPSMSGKISMVAQVAPSGEVENVEVASNTGLSPGVAACCAGVVRRAQFEAGAKPDQKRKLTIPVSFVPQR